MSTGGSPSAGRLLERGTRELDDAGIEGPRFQAQLLLRHALGWSREYLLAHSGETVAAEASGHFFQLLERRRGRVPLQYLTGSQEFYGHDFRVTPAVLIPRPETELLVEHTTAALAGVDAPRIVDVGTGSGCIAITLALEMPSATLLAVDASPSALAIARENAVRHEVADRVEIVEGDLLNGVDEGSADAVVSNPPYIAESDFASLEPEVSDHEPREALAGGADGLDVIRRLVPEAYRALAPGGWLFIEFGQHQDEAVTALASAAGFQDLEVYADLAGIARVIRARKM